MKKKIWIFISIIIILAALISVVVQVQLINKKIISLDAKVDQLAKVSGLDAGPAGSSERGYQVTIDMWHIFEQELQEYKQRLKEGKQFYDQQQTGWSSVLAELKKSLQEYDKFIAAEGEFWEKQLKNYDKLLARTEERFDILGQVIQELQNTVLEVQNLKTIQSTEAESKATETEPGQVKQGKPSEFLHIKPKIKGEGEYKTYPSTEDKEELEKEEKYKIIKGSVTGSGDYRTY